jgi:hypothetical protein
MSGDKLGETWSFKYCVGDDRVAAFGRFIMYKHPYYVFYAVNDKDFFIYFVEYNYIIDRKIPHATDKYDSIIRQYLEKALLQLPHEKNMIYMNYYDVAKELGLQDNDPSPSVP